MTWLDALKEAIVQQLITPLLSKHFPSGIPREAVEAVMPEVDRILSGEPVTWFELRSLILAVTDEKLRGIGAIG